MTTVEPALAFDREPQPGESARSKDVYGRLHVASAHISKSAVNTYFGREIPGWQALGLDQDRAYKLFRDPDELAAAADSFNNVPLMRRHVAHTAADHKPDLVIGSTGTDAKFEFPFLDNSLVVWPAADIEKIEEGLKKELSCSYAYTPDMTPGAFQGESYDGRMTRIIANHVSLVIAGRAGSEVAIGDSDIITGQWRQIERALLTAYGPTRAFDAWNESDHPRGQPENAGEFGPGGGSTKEESAAIKTA